MTLSQTALTSLPLVGRGKVRDTYALGDERLLLVTTDRLSAFDVVFAEPIPDKGRVLTQLSAWWFRRLAGLGPHHFLGLELEGLLPEEDAGLLRGRAMVVRRAERVAAECVVRGYLAGSGWAEYRRSGEVKGHPLPAGLREADRLPEPIFTPSTKEEVGHDINLTRAELADRIGSDLARDLEDRSLALFRAGAARAAEVGLILADTKFEFGWIDGKLALIDEALTPDSSRFWSVDGYQPGSSPPSLDKQFVRDFLDASGWDHEPPPPPLPPEVVAGTAARYRDAYRLLTDGAPLVGAEG